VLWHVNTGVPEYYKEFLHALDQVPGMILIVPHHCMSTSKPERMREILARSPTIYTDVSHGTPAFMADALRRIAKRPEDFKKIYREFPDRLLWGSDTVVTPLRKKTAKWMETMCGMYFGMLGDKQFVLHTYDSSYNETGTERLPGLDLPVDLQRRILQTNAEKVLGLPHLP
jgi:predicted TIM-barrel fold metal-dependent hydrolase